ncbi:MAG: 4-hydroxy-tetrahydrodipicolinate reductase [Candidatus Brocadiae bacterium]|nr:4-hydroxy-tetrahydrodipicolinate reductase [Candidatus Brocadiia bacterium]
MVEVGVSGACGRMGERILAILAGEGGARLAAAVEREGHPGLGRDVGEALGRPACGVGLEPRLTKKVDVLIDFSALEATPKRLAECVKLGVPILVCTTGLPAATIAALRAASKKIPVCVASNVSIGANLLFRLAAEAASVLGEGYDVEIVEAHHGMKKDAPSGTALTLAQRVAGALGRDLEAERRDGRRGNVGARTSREIGIHAVRGGDIVGEHTIYFAGQGERIEITHRASTRDTFARGAVRAAAWLAGAKPGLYGIEEVLGMGR